MSAYVFWLTGLPASGKTTLARKMRIIGDGHRIVLDGDDLRKHFWPDVGFTDEERHAHILRVAMLARKLALHGMSSMVSLVSPLDRARKGARALVEEKGVPFVLIHVNTPLGVCEARDPKGLYRLARSGKLPLMTGIGSPFEEPDDADIVTDGRDLGEVAREAWSLARKMWRERLL